MADDLRSKKLEWIRDGSNWLVGFAAGALVLSGTYFHDHFAHSRTAVTPLLWAWGLLTGSILAGVFTYFAAWKDLKEDTVAGVAAAPLGGWVRHSYTVMMWAFVLGYIVLTTALILNSLREEKPTSLTHISVPIRTGGASLSVDPPKDAEVKITVGGGVLDVAVVPKAAPGEAKP